MPLLGSYRRNLKLHQRIQVTYYKLRYFTINITRLKGRRELRFPTLSGLGRDAEGTPPTEEM